MSMNTQQPRVLGLRDIEIDAGEDGLFAKHLSTDVWDLGLFFMEPGKTTDVFSLEETKDDSVDEWYGPVHEFNHILSGEFTLWYGRDAEELRRKSGSKLVARQGDLLCYTPGLKYLIQNSGKIPGAYFWGLSKSSSDKVAKGAAAGDGERNIADLKPMAFRSPETLTQLFEDGYFSRIVSTDAWDLGLYFMEPGMATIVFSLEEEDDGTSGEWYGSIYEFYHILLGEFTVWYGKDAEKLKRGEAPKLVLRSGDVVSYTPGLKYMVRNTGKVPGTFFWGMSASPERVERRELPVLRTID